MKAVFIFAVVFLGWTISAKAQGEKTHSLKLDLTPLLDLGAIWEMKPQVLEDKFAASGFQTSPYFHWSGPDKKARDRAVFNRQPYRNIAVEVSLFGGKVPVEEAVITFKNGKPAELQIVIVSREETPGMDALTLSVQRDACETELSKLLGSNAISQPNRFGSKLLANADHRVWTGSKATATLDHSSEAGLLQFMLAPPQTNPETLTAKVSSSDASGNVALFARLDHLLKLPGLWELTPAKVEETFAMEGFDETPYYHWLSADKSSVRFSRKPFDNVHVDLSLFNGTVPVEEAIVEFSGGKASRASVSLYNRGDSGALSKDQFEQRYKAAGVALSKELGVRPAERKPNTQTAVKISGWIWTSPGALAALEYNTEALDKKGTPEFLRLKLAAPDNRAAFASESGQSIRKMSLGKSELPKFVKRETGGDVFVGGVPMVDQGAKGYCVVASCQRLFGFLQIPVDQHELAQVAESDAERGTNTGAMEAALKKIDSRFKVNFKPLAYRYMDGTIGVPYGNRVSEINEAKFTRQIQDYTAKGIPLLWALELGRFPEDPPIAEQSGGGHMRLILGLNADKGDLLFTDSWGAGHELKRMKLSDAYKATMAVYVIEPKEH